jgi:alanyl-tRNA synthetase
VKASEIRGRFVEFFATRGHTHVPSSSLVPHNDPTLLFVNAGMNQFKDVFTGREQRPYSRAVTVQKCVRAGGKHNDLDNVGFTPRHHTLFEMLGNFSFGDYFKPEAIEWGWEFLTQVVGLSAARLCVTVYSGEGEDAPPDDEAYELWARYVPRERIYRCSAKENFWQMGDTGPCGPCSEIHVHLPGDAPPDAGEPGKGPEHEDDRYLELWNLVFMQYEKHPDRSMTKLPKPSIDTGSGLERVAAAVGGFESNYDTDLLAPLVETAKRLAGPNAPTDKGEAPYRVIADHARATAFLIAEGVFPEKTKREYVLRRIMRRAIRHGTEVGLDEPFFHVVTAKVVEMFGDVYPELPARAATIEEVVRTEEEAFRRTLDRGLKRLRAAIANEGAVAPAVAADLYDTYGFPIDLTGVIAAEHGLTVDEAAAEEALRARQAEGGRGAELGADTAVGDLYFELHRRVGDTQFLGYEVTDAAGKVVALVAGGKPVGEAGVGKAVEVVLDRSPMYGESGGQIGDTGTIEGKGVRVEIADTLKPVGGLLVHRGTIVAGTLREGAAVQATVDAERRDAIRRNHSATHLLHLALRTELGEHVVQKGSLVAPDRLRFDFSHRAPLSDAQKRRIEDHVNRLILANADTRTEIMTPEGARESGAIGLFGEKYGDAVRVVRIGGDSLELCGGTHVRRSGDIGSFAIVGEGGIAQGVRRVEAVTGMGAVQHLQHLTRVTDAAMAELHAGTPDEVLARIGKLQGDLRAKEREIEGLQRKLVTGGAAAADAVVEVGGVKLLCKRVPVGEAKALRAAADTLRQRLRSGVVVLGSESAGKATLLVAVTKDLEARVHAGKLVGTLAAHVEGRGGGRPDLAQAGGPKLEGLDDALAAAPAALEEMLQ